MANRKLTKQGACDLAKRYGIKFSGDFHRDCNRDQAQYLSDLAKLVGYRQPKSASGSRARYFYDHLIKNCRI